MSIICITGTIGAGKGEVVNYLVKARGFLHLSARTLITEELDKQGLPHTRENMYDTAQKLRREFGGDYILRTLYKKAKEQNRPAVIESIRTLGEIETIRQHPDVILLGVDAPIALRYERIVNRGSSTDDISFEQFVAEENKEMHSNDPAVINLQGCLERADYIITNDGTLDTLSTKVESIIKMCEAKTISA